MSYRTLLVVLLFMAFLGCTRDDICPEDTPTTPLLIIQFKDITNRVESKPVSVLQVLVNDQDSVEAFLGTSDTLVGIPLNTLATNSEFLFIVNSNDTLNKNTDIIRFNYSVQEIYVNRACAFKVNYEGLNATLQPEDKNENWIRDFTILKTTVEDETEAHLTIFH
ncbi:MAG: hypothetical protein KJO23_03825 [Bacteroidia bacterium]|nr:hypothetical protein [Bacteroidia bacterium]